MYMESLIVQLFAIKTNIRNKNMLFLLKAESAISWEMWQPCVGCKQNTADPIDARFGQHIFI